MAKYRWFIIVGIVSLLIGRIMYINLNSNNTKIIFNDINEDIIYNGVNYNIISFTGKKEDEGYNVVLELEVSNNSEKEVKISAGDIVIESGGIHNGCVDFTYEDNNGNVQKMNISIKPETSGIISQKISFPKTSLSKECWQTIENRQFDILFVYTDIIQGWKTGVNYDKYSYMLQ